jgi:hypothetical protein
MWSDPGTWIALGVSVLFIVVGVVMHRVFTQILKREVSSDSQKASEHE